jgi:hypothetical protein
LGDIDHRGFGTALAAQSPGQAMAARGARFASTRTQADKWVLTLYEKA